MAKELSKSEAIDRILEIIDPSSAEQDAKIPNLLEYLTNMPTTPMYGQPMPTGEVTPQAEPTPENIAASISTPELPLSKQYPFMRKR